jgi:hypothetical protein
VIAENLQITFENELSGPGTEKSIDYEASHIQQRQGYLPISLGNPSQKQRHLLFTIYFPRFLFSFWYMSGLWTLPVLLVHKANSD